MNKRSLFGELNLIVLGCIIILLLAVSLTFYRTFSEVTYNRAVQRSKTIIKAVQVYLEDYFDDSVSKLKIIAETAEDSDSTLTDVIESQIKANILFDSSIKYFLIIDRSGFINYIFPYEEGIVGNDVSGLKYFKDGISDANQHWSTAVLSNQANEPVIYITYPFGEGLIAAEISLLPMLERIKYLDSGQGGKIGLIDEKGVYILHSDPELVKRREYSPFSSELGEWDQEGAQTGLLRVSDKEFFYAAKYIEQISGSLLFYESLEYVRASVKNSVFNFLLIAAVLFIFIIIIIFLSSKRISKPIAELNSEVQLIAAGDYSSETNLISYREFSSLLDNVKVMSEKIKKREDSLNKARIAAEEANEMKLQFLANMSHELRTPLNGIFGMTALLNYTELDPNQKVYLNNISVSADILLGLIQDLLDFSKINTGKLSLNYEPVKLTEIFNATASLSRHEAEAKGLTFNYEIAIPEETVLSDRVRLNQILTNLLTNALKFTDEGAISLRIQKLGQLLVIEVSDSGIGISERHKDKIFRSFVQLEDTFSKRHQGLGLGLAITENLVKLHNGMLELESTLNRGSTFRVLLPYPEILQD